MAAVGRVPEELLPHLRRARDLADRDYASPLDLSELAGAANLTVTEICHLVGYTSLGSFSAKFRQLVGTSPSVYQAKFAEHGAPRIPGCYVFMHGLSDRR